MGDYGIKVFDGGVLRFWSRKKFIFWEKNVKSFDM